MTTTHSMFFSNKQVSSTVSLVKTATMNYDFFLMQLVKYLSALTQKYITALWSTDLMNPKQVQYRYSVLD